MSTAVKKFSRQIIAVVVSVSVATALVMGSAASSATASPLTPPTVNWSANQSLTGVVSPGEVHAVQISADGTTALAAWIEEATTGDSSKTMVATAKINGNSATWGGPEEIGASTRGSGAPMAVLSADGTSATVLWSTRNDSDATPRVYASSGTIDGASSTWANATARTPDGTENNLSALAGSADASKLAIIVDEGSGSSKKPKAYTATVSGMSSTWSAGQGLGDDGYRSDRANIAMSADGTRATAIWEQDVAGDDEWKARTRSAAISSNLASWGSPTNLSASGAVPKAAHIAVSADGSRALAAWGYEGAPQNVQVASATVSGSGTDATWGTAQTLSEAGQEFSDLDGHGVSLTLSADGTQAMAAWAYEPTSNDVRSSVKAGVVSGTTSSWGDSQSVAPADATNGFLALSSSADGKTTSAAWMQVTMTGEISGHTRTASVKGTNAAWGAEHTLESGMTAFSFPQLAQSSDGKRAVALFNQATGADSGTMRAAVTTIKSGSEPDPAPDPGPVGKRKSQQLKKGATPKRIKPRGITVLNQRNAMTKQRRAVTARTKVMGLRGEVRCFRLIKGKQRKLSIRTYGKCNFRLRVTYTAKGNATYLPLKVVKTYRVKRG